MAKHFPSLPEDSRLQFDAHAPRKIPVVPSGSGTEKWSFVPRHAVPLYRKGLNEEFDS